MRLMLHYRGPLYANAGPDHKHSIRRVFHHQLRALWQQKPLAERKALLEPKTPSSYDHSLLRPLQPFTFAPLVTQEMNAVAELAVVIMRPEPPGNLLTQGGDMDNRLKTLFDALTMPRHSNALPKGGPQHDELPYFFCLLEDDNLVTELDVKTEQLLESNIGKNDVDLTVRVQTRVTRSTMGNFDFA
jgi:hypothetical protein